MHSRMQALPCYSNPADCRSHWDVLIRATVPVYDAMNSLRRVQLDRPMVQITDFNDAIGYGRHLTHIHFREPCAPNVDLDDGQTVNENPRNLLTDETAA